MSHHKGKHTPYCLNCHYPTAEHDTFCPNCGQKNTDGKVSLHDLVHEFVHSIFHLDGKFFTTLRHLFIPGKLTVEFFSGHHKRYAHPVQLFIVLCGLSLIFSGKFNREVGKTVSKNTLNREQVEGRSQLFELDSIAKIRYKDTPSVFDSVHAVLVEKNNYYNKGIKKMSPLEDAYRNALIAIQVNREDLTFLQNYLKNKKDTVNNFRINRAIDIHQQRLTFLFKDTASLRQKLRSDTLIKHIETLETQPAYQIGRKFGKYIANSTIKDAQKKDELGDILSFADTVQQSYILLPSEEKVRLLNWQEINTIKRDSTRLLLVMDDIYKLDDRDILNLSFTELIQKYKIEGWLSKFLTKMTYNFSRDVGGVMTAFLGKKVYIYLVLMLPLAGFMYWLYRRQKCFYVEHVVFLMHYFCLGFMLEILNLFIDTEIGWLAAAKYTVSYLILLPIGIKTYYQQSWVKSYVKAILIVLALYIMVFIILILGFFLSLGMA